ncbi:MAG: phosphatidylglycerol lysyltransferase domain-containing protein [Endomicrobium sp.]|nr:phosphatidylglycerol lysyltransferase domain-containing protein [Endomicrobium sp.]
MSSGIVRYVKCDKDIFAYIVFKNILLAKSNGYKWFNMGLAYDSSMDSSGDVIKYFAKMFMFAEHFKYNLSALRDFKDKFCPMWHSKYIAIHPDKYIIAFIKNFTELISPPKTAEGPHFLRRFFKR